MKHLFVRNECVLCQSSFEEVVLFNLNDGQYYSLNEVGSRVWDLCDGSRSAAQIVCLLVEEYDAPAVTVETDVVSLIANLLAKRLVLEVLQPPEIEEETVLVSNALSGSTTGESSN